MSHLGLHNTTDLIPLLAERDIKVMLNLKTKTSDACNWKLSASSVTVAIRSGETASQIGPARGLGQELHPQLLATQDRRQVARLLFVRAELDQRGGEDAERRHVERERHVVGRRLLRERALILDGQAEPAVLDREADPGEAALPELRLQAALDVAALVAAVVPAGADRRHVGGEPRACPLAEVVEAFGGTGHDAAPSRFVAMRSAWNSGVPTVARFTVTRRR